MGIQGHVRINPDPRVVTEVTDMSCHLPSGKQTGQYRSKFQKAVLQELHVGEFCIAHEGCSLVNLNGPDVREDISVTTSETCEDKSRSRRTLISTRSMSPIRGNDLSQPGPKMRHAKSTPDFRLNRASYNQNIGASILCTSPRKGDAHLITVSSLKTLDELLASSLEDLTPG